MPTSAAVTRVAAIQEIANRRLACDGRLTSVGAGRVVLVHLDGALEYVVIMFARGVTYVSGPDTIVAW
jgi:hypothetical protein